MKFTPIQMKIVVLAASQRQRSVTAASRLLAAIGAKLVRPKDGLQVVNCRTFGAQISSSVPLSIPLLAAIGAKLIGFHGDRGLRYTQERPRHPSDLGEKKTKWSPTRTNVRYYELPKKTLPLR